MPGPPPSSWKTICESTMRNPLDLLKNRHDPIHSPGLKRIMHRRFTRFVLVSGVSAAVVGVVIISALWYAWALSPLDSQDTNNVRITIKSGAQPAQIAQDLKDAHLIHSAYAFQIYTRLSGQENKLQAGTYAFAPDQSVRDIVAHLASGKTDEFTITILPGQTIKDITTMLEGHGYTPQEISDALNAAYTNPLIATRGTQTSLEGFFYPDTYNVLSDETLQTIFARIFDHFSDEAAKNNLSAGFAAHGLSLYQGITLASIVQREVSGSDDQRKVASVFYNRLDADMALGSDVTFIYGASLLGVEPTPSLDSPYNLRIHKGLTPTPISNPQLSALQAVANPAATDYLFFLSGDDGVTYFAHTDAEHEQNIKLHCQVKCQ